MSDRLVQVAKWVVVVLCLAAGPSTARAVIVLGGRDASGTLDNSGQNSNPAPYGLSNDVGLFGNYLGTPINSRYFLTANHIGDGFLNHTNKTGTFIFNNGTSTPTTYTVSWVATQNDLALWKIADDNSPGFTVYAPVYRGSSEPGQDLVVLGRGTSRGAVVNSPQTNQPVGWQWGSANPSVTWGTGTFNNITTVPNTPGFGGDFLNWSFAYDPNKPDTGILSDGDSGGPVFVHNPVDNQYELAGINSLVDQVSASPDPNGTALLRAALYDARGFYNGSDQITGASPVPLGSYASRISSAMFFINGGGVEAVPEPAGVAVALLGCVALMRRRRD
jgi:hypothetical protein